MKKNFKKIYRSFLSSSLLLSLIIGQLILPIKVSAQSFTFDQASWAGGVSATTATNASNQTGWTKYSSANANAATNLNIGASLSLKSISDSTTQTTNADFNGTNSQTSISGNSVQLAISGSPAVTPAVAASSSAIFLMRGTGQLYGWGYGAQGDVPNDCNSTTQTIAYPTALKSGPNNANGFFTNAIKILPGNTSVYAVRSDNTLWSWGDNSSNQLGRTSVNFCPGQVMSGVVKTAGGLSSGYAVKSDGTVWSWGNNTYGKLGDGTTTTRTTPVQVLGPGGVGFLDHIVDIAASAHSAYALKDDGTVWSWGNNLNGRLGDNTTTNRSTPVQVSGLTGVIALTANFGGSSIYALKSDHTLWAWGFGSNGRLGTGDTNDALVPVQVLKGASPSSSAYLENVTAVAAGNASAYAILSDGTLWAWGSNAYGNLGTGNTTQVFTPVQVLKGASSSGSAYLEGVTAVTASAATTHAIKSDGTVWSWGNGGNGEMGNGSFANSGTYSSTTPLQVLGIDGSGAPINAGYGNYYPSGNYTSGVIDLSSNVNFTTLSYSTTLNSQTVTVDVRAGDSATAPVWGSTDSNWASTGLTGVASGGNISTLGAHRYLQYRVNLSTSDLSVTPTFNDITFNYTHYTSSDLTSSIYNTQDATTLVSGVTWTASSTNSTDQLVKFQVRSSPDGTTWTNWCGYSDCSGSTYFNSADNGVALNASHILKSGNNDQYFQYKIFLSGGANTPTVTDVKVTYVINAAPLFNVDYPTTAAGGVTASQISDSTNPDWGKVAISYSVKDTDSTTGSNTPGKILPSFQYSTNGGSTWTAIPSGNLGASDTSLKNVLEGSYTTYNATWDAKTTSPGISIANAKIRVTVNDGELANSTTSASSANFILDTLAPVVSSIHLNNSITNNLTFTATDTNNLKDYKISNNSDMSADGVNASSGTFQATSASTSYSFSGPWNLITSSAPTVYLSVRDIYGNTSATPASVTIPLTPTSLQYKDVSDAAASSPSYLELLLWDLYPNPAPAGASFGSYDLYRSTDGVNFSKLSNAVADQTANYRVDGGLNSTTTYSYKVQFITANGDKTAFSNIISDIPDGSGGIGANPFPTITNVAVTNIKNTSVTVTWTTDDVATSRVDYGATTSYGNNVINTAYVKNHSIDLTGLTPNTVYTYKVTSTNLTPGTKADDNGGAGYTFTTAGGPQISAVTATNITSNSATITWNTNKTSDSYVYYSSSVSGGALVNPILIGNSSLATGSGTTYAHSINLTGLSPAGHAFYYTVKSTDTDSNTTIDTNGVTGYYQFNTITDTTPPVISGISTPIITTDSVAIIWNTDEPSDSQVSYGTSAGTYTTTTTLDTTLTSSHLAALTGLTPSTTYYYVVKSKDASGNLSTSAEQTVKTSDSIAVVSVSNIIGVAQSIYDKLFAENEANKALLKDRTTTPPVISNISVGNITPFGAEISFDTDKDTIAFVNYGKDTKYGKSEGDPVFAKTHIIKLSGLTIGTDYHFVVSAIDKWNNTATSDDQTFRTKFLTEDVTNAERLSNIEQFQNEIESNIESILPSLVAPFVDKPVITDITENSAKISFNTNIKTYPVVAYTPDSLYNKSKDKPYDGEISDTSTKTLDHTLSLINLKPNTKYHVMAKAFSLPEVIGKSVDVTFNTKAVGIKASVIDRTNTSFKVVWNTPDPTSSIVEYKNLKNGKSLSMQDDVKNLSHSIRVENLDPGTSYEIKVSGMNAQGNTVEGTEAIVVKTSTDTTPPVITNLKVDSALVVGRTDKTQTIVSWTTDEPATSIVSYEEGPGSPDKELANKQEDNELTKNHVVILTVLKPGTIYRFQISSIDDVGNGVRLPIRTIITPRQAESIVDIIFKNFDETFNFVKNVK